LRAGAAPCEIAAPQRAARKQGGPPMRSPKTALVRSAAATAALLALAGCEVGSQTGAQDGRGGFRQAVGLEAPPPDETLVVARRPLVVPPDFDTLPPPRPGAPSRVERDPQAEAQAALLGGAPSSPPPSAAPSTGEAALLAATGADAADPSIRQTVIAETPEPDRRFGLTSFLGRPIPNPAIEAERLSPVEEAERLREQGLPAPAPEPDAFPE
jgi:hypothetical protein